MQRSKALKRFPNTHKKKSRFGLTEGAGQCFIFWNGMCGKATGRARSPSRPATRSYLTIVGLREAERPPVELWVTIVVAKESS